jgi:TPR repeat protein
MNCPLCNSPIESGWLFCASCSAPLDYWALRNTSFHPSPEPVDDAMSDALRARIMADVAAYREHNGTDDDVDALFRGADAARCEEWLRAASLHCPEAQWLASRCYRLGHGVAEDIREADRLCDFAAQQGEPLALYDLACRYEAGIDIEPDLTQAAELYYRVAKAGIARAQCRLAECCLRSGASEWELAEAAKWLRAAARQGSVAAEERLADLYIAEGSKAMAPSEGANWLLRSATRGNPDSQRRLARCHADGEGIARDRDQALRWYQSAVAIYQGQYDMTNVVRCYRGMAELGEAEFQYLLAECFAGGDGIQRDLPSAVVWLEKAAETGHAQARARLPELCFELGEALADRADGSRLQEADFWYCRAAALGSGKACLRLAECHAAGKGFEQRDMTEAALWFRKAAELGEPVGLFRLGLCHASGEGVERDEREAHACFQRAADAGVAPAQFKVGIQLLTGNGVPKDAVRGAQYLARAAEQGYVRAQTKLGQCYCTGQGVAKNWNSAAKWLSKAAKAGDENAQQLLRKYGARR